MPKNPRGFPERLKLLMDGAGLNSRALSLAVEKQVSHSTIENWLNDSTEAGRRQVEVVATVLGWEVDPLLNGYPPPNAATRLAELESALGKLRRHLQGALAASNAALGVESPVEGPWNVPRSPIIKESESERDITAAHQPALKRAAGQRGSHNK
jgi:hypothetical protein